MPYNTFPDYKYRRGGVPDRTFNHQAAQLGDGYEDLSAHGINSEQWQFTASFTGLSEADRNTIVAFLRGQGAHTPFYFPMEGEGNQLARMLGFSDSTGDGDLWTISLTIKRTYRADE